MLVADKSSWIPLADAMLTATADADVFAAALYLDSTTVKTREYPLPTF